MSLGVPTPPDPDVFPSGELRKSARIIAVLPAYNAEKTLEATLEAIPPGWVDHVILVDDGSKDGTVALAQRLGLEVHQHPQNRGYGGNQKTCFEKALAAGADIVILLHPDNQYDPRYIPALVSPLLEGSCHAVFGSRLLGGSFLEGGMPVWKYYGNVFLTAAGNIALTTYLSEFHSGFRAYSKHYLETVRWHENRDGFVFDTEIIVQGLLNGLRIEETPIPTRYFEEASSIPFTGCVTYTVAILWTLFQAIGHRQRWWSISSFRPR